MSDYIEREAALAYPIRKDKCDRKHANKHFIFGIESVIEFVEDLPAADVVPVVRCKDCVSHGNCLTEDTFRIARIENPYCCGGKQKEANT